MDFSHATIRTLHDGLQKKEFSSAELTQEYLARVHAVEPVIHAFLQVAEESALARARDVDAKISHGEKLGILEGQPMAVKDVLMTKGLPTTAGSKFLQNYIAPYTATAVKKLQDAGAVLIGKTNCDEFAMGASGENSAYGPTKNPWDITRVPGGSSSGSAAAVAAGEAVFALGTDTGGSIRQPAGFCGVVGLKPTYGRVSRYGLVALASSLDQIGPLARTVDDAAIVLQTISGSDRNDASSVSQPIPDPEASRAVSLKGLKVGIPQEYFIEGLDEGTEKLVRAALAKLEEAGAELIDVHLPHTEYALAVYYILQPAEASTNLARFDGIRYGTRIDAADLESVYRESRHAGFGSEPKRRIMLGTYALSAGYYDAFYRKAQKVRTLIKQDFTEAFKKVDVLASPTSPGLPFPLGEKTQDPLAMYLADVLTVAANIAGIPALSMPCGRAGSLPVGFQLMGPQWSEERILGVGLQLEQLLALPLHLPDIGT